jgi:hypothetical protein
LALNQRERMSQTSPTASARTPIEAFVAHAGVPPADVERAELGGFATPPQNVPASARSHGRRARA